MKKLAVIGLIAACLGVSSAASAMTDLQWDRIQYKKATTLRDQLKADTQSATRGSAEWQRKRSQFLLAKSLAHDILEDLRQDNLSPH